MTEAEWLACEDPKQLLRFRAGRKSDRKLRLWACACCRRVAYLMVDEGKRAIEVAERYADGQTNAAEVTAARAALQPYIHTGSPEAPAWAVLSEKARELATEIAWAVPASEARAVEVSIEVSGPDSVSAFGTPQQARATLNAVSVGLLRDIFGNPFRPVSFSPAWRTDTAVALARQMYEARDFGAMPILADALQDAGCDNPDILSHCRGSGPHVRGCWVVDLVLGKE